MYFSQRRPEELASFSWVLDAKDQLSKTRWEAWWEKIVKGHVDSKSRREGLPAFDEGDYSHMKRFEVIDGDEALQNAPWSLNMILGESFRFSSDAEIGLELVDILSNAVRRALKGNLGYRAWRAIPKLMIHERGKDCIEFAVLKEKHIIVQYTPYSEVVEHFRVGRRAMLFR